MTEEVQDPSAVLAELRRAQEDLKALRTQLKTLEAEKETLASQVEAMGSDEMRMRALQAEVKVALQGQGIKDADRLLKYVGTDGLDFDEAGKLTGLDDRLKSLKTDLPELFDAKRRVGGKADIFAEGSAPVTKSSTELQVERIFGR